MAESSGTEYRIGHLRMKYLDLASVCFAQEKYMLADGFIDDFLNTIVEDSDVATQIKEELDQVNQIKNENMKRLKESSKNLSYLKKRDLEMTGTDEIEVNVLHDKKEICWKIAMQNGLFYE